MDKAAVNTRNYGIDRLRTVAIFSIITLHCFPFFHANIPYAELISSAINQAARFAVPCFFVLSGYLYSRVLNTPNPVVGMARFCAKLLALYFLYSVIYLLPYNIWLNTVESPSGTMDSSRFWFYIWTQNYENFLFGGYKYHLWFLPALAIAAFICTTVAWIERLVGQRMGIFQISVGCALFIAGVIGGAYKNSIIGFDFEFYTRNGPFFSTLFFASGIYISTLRGDSNVFRISLWLIAFGATSHFLEVYFLTSSKTITSLPDYVFGTYFFGVGAALLAIRSGTDRDSDLLSRLGAYGLGIYALHPFIIDMLTPAFRAGSQVVAWQVIAPFVVFSLTAILVVTLARSRFLRPILK
ncbi:Surface polysaccharide O-acyltransferase, integral membrane enzyme [Pseudomonas pohangensis]|uniref:Surface polysaccharide O-acyltransferase, integral membrane enzyme n=1 Tax=Pseudomonas pohangensis TaxID=364197 RepID=A0A1H2HRL2_9PSED|nr:acyltransferase family protein [Pseudomonas pohangensis]SDU34542.1 Surface polysaccharide O-acyltransferase, integral membrane enzyme [Pseudomonas pohangensis]